MKKQIIIRQNGETLFCSEQTEVLTFDLDDMDEYDWYEQSVETVFTELTDLDGPSKARLVTLLSQSFLRAHGEREVFNEIDLS